MRYEQNAVLTSLRRAQQFFDDNTEGLSALNSTARRELDDVAGQLTTLSVAQETGKRGGKGETARSHALRLMLRQNHMGPVVAVAKYKLQAVPEFAALTQPGAELSAQALVSSALSMADAAAPHARIFIDSGLSVTFVDDLRTAAQAVSDSVLERDNHHVLRSGATAGLAALERRGRALLRILNALILAQIGDNAQLRREWTTAKTVQQKPGPSASAHASAHANAQSERPAGGQPAAVLMPTSAPVAVSLSPAA